MKIDGKTQIYGILGDPIQQVAVPELLNSMYSKQSINKVLVPFHVHQNTLETVILGLKNIQNFKGAIITMPHKTEIIQYLDEVSDEVQKTGACNVIKKTADGIIKGTLLDGKGFIQGLKSHNFTVESKNVFIQGCGGAATAIIFALCENGIQKLSIYNRTKSKVIVLIHKLKTLYPTIDISYSDTISGDIDILINATSVGMHENDQPLLSLYNLSSEALVADIITNPQMTCTLKKAKEKGCKIYKGIAMLEGQLELMNAFME